MWENRCNRRTALRRWRMAACALALATVVATATAQTGSAGQRATCGSAPPAATGAPPAGAAAVALDGSISTASTSLRREYRQAALAAVETAANEQAAVRIVIFGASGVGARVIFSGSFVPVSTVYAFNLAARNHLLCVARHALASAFVGRARLTGTDVAGATAEQIGWGRSAVRRHGHVSVLTLTDGCQAPSPSGPNANLTDLCGALRAGRKPSWILAHHHAEFSFGNGRGVHVTMEGVGVGADAAAASTIRAEKLVRFWQLDCRRSHAVCSIRSAAS